jgi:cytochrome c-type biogenesis protein CcmH
VTRARPNPLLATIVTLLLCAGMTSPARAIRPDEVLANPVLEARARAIGSELRCLVCQNESIDDSDADLAHDLRMLVRQRLLAGDSDDEVKQYLVVRYGTYVLLKPPFNPETVFLWLGPLGFLLCAAGTAAVFYRRSARQPAEIVQFSADEKQRLAALIGDTPTNTGET